MTLVSYTIMLCSANASMQFRSRAITSLSLVGTGCQPDTTVYTSTLRQTSTWVYTINCNTNCLIQWCCPWPRSLVVLQNKTTVLDPGLEYQVLALNTKSLLLALNTKSLLLAFNTKSLVLALNTKSLPWITSSCSWPSIPSPWFWPWPSSSP